MTERKIEIVGPSWSEEDHDRLTPVVIRNVDDWREYMGLDSPPPDCLTRAAEPTYIVPLGEAYLECSELGHMMRHPHDTAAVVDGNLIGASAYSKGLDPSLSRDEPGAWDDRGGVYETKGKCSKCGQRVAWVPGFAGEPTPPPGCILCPTCETAEAKKDPSGSI